MKQPKPKRSRKVVFPRRNWKINPVTRVEKSVRTYSRKAQKRIVESESADSA